MIGCSIQAIGILGPGLPAWQDARPALAGERAWEYSEPGRIVAPDLPRTEARRATHATHLALAAAHQAMAGQAPPDDSMPSVWAAGDSDLVGLEKNCRTLADDPPWISPHRFQNSVHNTPSGYWSIATGCHGPATAVCSADETFAAGLVEAVTTLREGGERCLYVAYDEVSPPSLRLVREVPFSFAVALLLAADDGTGIPLAVDLTEAAVTSATACADDGLERLRRGNPAARSLPLLCAIATGAEETIHLSWSDRFLALRVGARS